MQVIIPSASKAQSASYTKSLTASTSYPDTSGMELTDGGLGSPTDFHDASWQGHQSLGSTPLDVTVDLGSGMTINAVRSTYYQDTGNGIYKPATVEIFTSSDNTTFTSRGTTAAAAAMNDVGNRWHYDTSFAPLITRYLRFRMTTGG